MKKAKEILRETWTGSELCMDTCRELEGLHLYMMEYGVREFTDGTKETINRSISEHVDRERARQIRNEIDRRLFGGVEYKGMPNFLK